MNNEETVKTLVENFTSTITTRLTFLLALTFIALHFNILPIWVMAPVAFILAFHLVELTLINLSFQAHFNNDHKFDMMLKVLDYVTLSMSIVYLLMIALIAVL
jgi:hypothetical protein